ncbi:MAG: PmbA/TldA family metallopeptidase [Candidatus Sifarchaeia archaeon]
MEDLAQAAVEAALDSGATFADVRIENTVTTIIEMSDGVTKRSLASRLRGAGIRAFVDGAWTFGQTTDLSPKGMRDTGVSLGRLAVATKSKVVERFDIDGPTFKDRVEYKVKTPFEDISFEDKMAFTKMIDDQAKSFDNRIVNTRTIYGDLWTRMYTANSLGTSVWSETSLPRIISVSFAKDGTSRRTENKEIQLNITQQFTKHYSSLYFRCQNTLCHFRPS